MKKHIGSTIALVLGFLSFAGSVANPANSSGLIAGPVIILGALAYRSAKKRKLREVGNSILRKALEAVALVLIAAAILLQKNLLALVESDPVPNLIIPLWVLIAYIVVSIKKYQPTEQSSASENT